MSALIRTIEDLAQQTERIGILPFFRNTVPGWSVEDMADRSVWFTGSDGPWEWKGQLAFEKKCVYGKFIRGRAAFIHPSWFKRLAAWRRDGFDWEARSDQGLVPRGEGLLMAYVTEHPMCQSRHIKRALGMGAEYDKYLSRLQMLTYVCMPDFQYSISKKGVPYGWGNAVIDLPDRYLYEEMAGVGELDPDTCHLEILNHLADALPGVPFEAFERELRL